MSGIDWAKIRAEYVNSDISLAMIAEKYEISASVVQKRSQKEKWSEKRKQMSRRKADKVAEQINDKNINQTVKDIDKLVNATNKLLTKINTAINQVDKEEIVTQRKIDEVLVAEEVKNEGGKTKTTTSQTTDYLMKRERVKTLIDTKKISDLSKSLLNVKMILSDIDDSTEENRVGIIEIPEMAELEPPDEEEVTEDE
jgi:hypothetical protein